MEFIGQKHARGCGVAALAMISETSYDWVASWFPGKNLEVDGIYQFSIDRWLWQNGFFTRRLFIDELSEVSAKNILCVTVNENSPCLHFAVLAGGLIFDPLETGPVEEKKYHKILNVTGVTRAR